jgi:tol-pal system protein YbgF
MSRNRILAAAPAALSVLLLASGTALSADAPGSYRVADLFGESDDEKARRLQHEQNQDDAIRSLNDKTRDLEDTIRNLTGENETLAHRVDELNAKIDRMQKDFEYRICQLSAQQLGAGDANSVPCGATGSGGTLPTASLPPPVSGPATPPAGLAPGPRVLGTLPAGSAVLQPSGGAPASNSGAQPQYSAAMSLLARAQYDEASAAFRSVADTYPKDDLAPQSIYWIGDIAYVQKDYANAARSFAEVIKKYPTAPRAPDSMLKLGQALIGAGQKKEGCTALAALPAKYPKAPKATLDKGADARKANCH